MITAASLSVLALSACGSQAAMRTGQVADTQTRSSSIQVGADGGQVMSDGNGGSVSIGADGVHIDTGDRSVSIGADGTHIDTGAGSVGIDANGVTVNPGSTSRPKATSGTPATGSGASRTPSTPAAGTTGVGDRQATFGTTGQVTLTGGLRFAGAASSAVCDVNADQRTITAQLLDGMTLVIDANGVDQSSMTLTDANDATWRADFNGTVALSMTATTTTVVGVRLVGPASVVTLSATFAC